MKRLSILLLISVFASSIAMAQPEHRRERIKALKVGYITEKIDLSAKQAEAFWPLYNKYESQMHELRKEFYQQYRKDNPDGNREQAKAYIEADLDYQQRMLDTKKEYKKKFLDVISEQQLADLYQAERGFRQMLVKELRNRNMQQQRQRRRPAMR